MLLAVLFPSFPRDVQMLKRMSPLDDDLDQLYIDKLSVMAKAMVRGVFIIALAQGLTQGLFYWIAGVPYLFFVTLLSIVAAMLPSNAHYVKGGRGAQSTRAPCFALLTCLATVGSWLTTPSALLNCHRFFGRTPNAPSFGCATADVLY